MTNPARYIRKVVFEMTQTKFAALLDVRQATVLRWEKLGHVQRITEQLKIRQLAKKLNLDWNDSYFFEEPDGKNDGARRSNGATKSTGISQSR